MKSKDLIKKVLSKYQGKGKSGDKSAKNMVDVCQNPAMLVVFCCFVVDAPLPYKFRANKSNQKVTEILFYSFIQQKHCYFIHAIFSDIKTITILSKFDIGLCVVGGLIDLRIRTSSNFANLRIANLLSVLIQTIFETARIPIFVIHDRRNVVEKYPLKRPR